MNIFVQWFAIIYSFYQMSRYPKREIHNLARFISVKKFHPLSWRAAHPYVLVDRFEDVTPPDRVHVNNKCDRNITLYGYLRGCNMKKGTKVHILIFECCCCNVLLVYAMATFKKR